MRNRILARKREGWQGKKLPPPHRHHERHIVSAAGQFYGFVQDVPTNSLYSRMSSTFTSPLASRS
jgi:hypothetical protein